MTKYSVEGLSKGVWEGLALFSDEASITAMKRFCGVQMAFDRRLEKIHLIEIDTGEVLYDMKRYKTSFR